VKSQLCSLLFSATASPHWHPNRENVTVISGSLEVGMGDTFDQSKLMTFGAGSFTHLDPSMHH
jgi:hypothetical protein